MLGAVYEQTRARIAELASDADATAPVPACPQWTVHDVVAHLAGICADVMAGNVAGSATDAWTAVQVDARRTMPLREILEEWDAVGPPFAARIDAFPGWLGKQVVADVTAHEHDIRGALGRRGARDSQGVAVGLDFLVGGWLDAGLTAMGLGPLEVRADGRSWLAGSGGPAAPDVGAFVSAVLLGVEPAARRDAPPAGSVTASPFELFRAVSGRRSAAQIRRFAWTVDPEPYLPAFELEWFTLRPTDLCE